MKIEIKYIEKWKRIYINNIKTQYKVSNTGKIKNTKTNKILKQSEQKGGYMKVSLSVNGKIYYKRVHRLVAEAFIINEDKSANQVNHKDCNKKNNKKINLEWCTAKYNMKHAYNNKLIKPPILRGSKIGNSILKEDQVKKICKMFEDGRTINYIIKYLKIKDKEKVKYQHILYNIYSRRNWIHISKHYSWEYKPNHSKKMDEDIIYDICNMIQEGYNIYEIINKLGIPKSEIKRYKQLIYDIKRKKNWIKISDKFNL